MSNGVLTAIYRKRCLIFLCCTNITYYTGWNNILSSQCFFLQIAVVSQDCVLFARSVRENIKYGVEASDEEMFRVARLASAHDFILRLPNGYDTGQKKTEQEKKCLT